MIWQSVLFISIIANSFSLIFGKFIINDKECEPATYSIVFQTIVGLIILVYANVMGEFSFNLKGILPFFLLSPILYFLVNILRANALKVTDSSEYMVILSTGSVWSIFLATLFLKERITLMHLLGAVLIMIGVVIVSQFNFSNLQLKKGEALTILVAFFASLAFVNDAFILKQNFATAYAAYGFLVPGILTAIVYPNAAKKAHKIFNKRNFKALFAATALTAVSVISIYKSYQLGGNVSLIAPLSQITTILTVILGIVILKERNHVSRKLIATAISILGVILISL